MLKSFTGIEECATPARAGYEGRRTAEGERERQFPGEESKLSFLSSSFDRRTAPKRNDGSLNDAGSGQKGAGYALADVTGGETQALVQFVCAGISLRPGVKLPKLLFDNGSGAIFHGAAHNSSLVPKLRSKGKSWLHQRSPNVRIEPGSQLQTHYLPFTSVVNIASRIE